MDIQWETPPAPTRGPQATTSEERELAQALLDNPDKWARFKDFPAEQRNRAGNLANTIRQGKRAAFRVPRDRDGVFEAITRTDRERPGVRVVYVRYTHLHAD